MRCLQWMILLHPSSFDKMLPKDPVILLSFVNTKLRDEFDDLAELNAAFGLEKDEIADRLAVLDYHYDAQRNQFV